MEEHPVPIRRRVVLCIVSLALLGLVRSDRAEGRGRPSRAALRKASHTTPPAPLAPPPRGRSTPQAFSDWVFWYHHNADRLEAEVAPAHRITPDGITPHAYVAVLETLRALIADQHASEGIRADALRALARGLRDAQDVGILVRRLDDPTEGHRVRAGAVMGLGMMVRAAPPLVLPDSAWESARRALLRVAESDHEMPRLRGLAFCSLALLATQPGSGTAPEDAARSIATWMSRPDLQHDVSVGALHALTLLPPDAVGPEVRERLGAIVREGTVGKDRMPNVMRSYAAAALGRVGDAGTLEALLTALRRRRGVSASVQRSVAIALGRLGPRLPIEERTSIVNAALERLERAKDDTTRHFLLMALPRLLVAGSTADAATLLDRTQIERVLFRVMDKGKHMDRCYGALALGLAVRHLPAVGAHGKIDEFRQRAVESLRVGLHDKQLNQRVAFMMALGLARDTDRVPTLRMMAADRQRSQSVRAYALLALALVAPTRETHRLALQQVQVAVGEVHGRMAARVLGLTGNSASASTITLLGRALRGGLSWVPAGEAAVALARTGRAEAADLLMSTAVDRREQDLFRSLAVAGLGRIVDPEHVPTLTRLTEGLNYRASTDLISHLLGIL